MHTPHLLHHRRRFNPVFTCFIAPPSPLVITNMPCVLGATRNRRCSVDIIEDLASLQILQNILLLAGPKSCNFRCCHPTALGVCKQMHYSYAVDLERPS